MVRVKICGISQVEHALAASHAGADFIGVVFAESRRQVTFERAAEIASAIREIKRHPLSVGVFVNTPPQEVNRTACDCGLDMVQLSGDEPWEYCLKIEKPIIKTVHVPNYQDTGEIMRHLEQGFKMLGGRLFAPLLDSGGGGVYGGTGKVFSWAVAREVSRTFKVLLAGGLTPENVGEAIRLTTPWGVDVSSGVETNGKKDAAKIKAFIESVRYCTID